MNNEYDNEYKQRKIKLKLRIKLNHNRLYDLLWVLFCFCSFVLFSLKFMQSYFVINKIFAFWYLLLP